jgi:hypothetical protein
MTKRFQNLLFKFNLRRYTEVARCCARLPVADGGEVHAAAAGRASRNMPENLGIFEGILGVIGHNPSIIG